MPLRVYVRATFRGNLPEAQKILTRSAGRALDALGRHLVGGVQGRVREFSGQEKRAVRHEVTGSGLNRFLFVFGNLWQHWVDELGLPPGTFPPWGVGSRIFNYVRRKGLARIKDRRSFHSAGTRRRARRVSHVRSRRPKGSAGYSGPAKSGPRGRGVRAAGTRQGRGRRATESRPTKSARATARDNSTRRVAFLIARAIFERGIRAGQPFRRTLEANRAKIIRDVSNAFRRAVNAINAGGTNASAD